MQESTGDITQADLIVQLDTLQDGGINVQPDGWTHLYGSTHQVFGLSKSINVNKFTQLQYEHEPIISKDQNPGKNETQIDIHLEVCFYETLEIKDIEECSSRCQEVQVGSDQRIEIGDIFNDRKTSINFIGFKQTNVWHDQTSMSSEYSQLRIGQLRFLYDVDKRLRNDNGSCTDKNARIVRGFNNTSSCQCLDGFMASNGGLFQEVYDSCIDCFDHPDCPLDAISLREGETGACAKVRNDAMINNCSNFTIMLPGTHLSLLHSR